ncbi:MAG: repeat-containing protein, partial [Chitinophagaceae bacterium]|nr:repeat-containing protein [Chitinophagaceae bacterium]
MKYYSFAISGLTLFTLFLLLPGEALQAQYVSYKNEDGSNKTPEQRKAEEASNKQKNTQYKPSTSSTPGTTTEKESLTREERFKQSRIDQAKRDAIIKNVPTGGVVYDAVDWEAGDNDSRRVQLKGKWGMIDKTGKIIIPVQYKTLGLLKCGICPVKDEKNNDWYFLDNTGKENSPDRYTNISATSICWEGELNGKWASVYKSGPATLAYNVNDIFEGLIAASMQRKRGFVDLNGKIIIPLEYNQVHPFTNGLACVQKGTALFDPWGAINPEGKVVIPIIYEFTFSFA